MRTLRARRSARRMFTSLGDLVSAIYEAMNGSVDARARQTALVLTASPLAQRLSRRIRVVD